MRARKPSEPVIVPEPLDLNAALHNPFSWLHSGAQDDRGAEFAALTMDVCSGIDLCLDVLHADYLVRRNNLDAEPGEEERPAFSPSDGERLLRFAMSSARLLAEVAEARIRCANERARRAEGATS